MHAADIRKILVRKNKKLEGTYPKGKMSENDARGLAESLIKHADKVECKNERP